MLASQQEPSRTVRRPNQVRRELGFGSSLRRAPTAIYISVVNLHWAPWFRSAVIFSQTTREVAQIFAAIRKTSKQAPDLGDIFWHVGDSCRGRYSCRNWMRTPGDDMEWPRKPTSMVPSPAFGPNLRPGCSKLGHTMRQLYLLAKLGNCQRQWHGRPAFGCFRTNCIYTVIPRSTEKMLWSSGCFTWHLQRFKQPRRGTKTRSP